MYMDSREPEEVYDGQMETEDTGTTAGGSGAVEDLRVLEALLFASDELMTAARLKAILPGEPNARKIRSMVETLNAQLQKERHPFEIVEIGGGYQFRTITYYHPWVRQIFKEKSVKKLSIQALECLAIIAYKQPLTKADIEAIRGVISDGAMKTLLEKHFIMITGRSDKPGRPLLYGTTKDFLTYFGLNKIDEMPRIEEFEALAREKIDDLSIGDLDGPGEEAVRPDMFEDPLENAVAPDGLAQPTTDSSLFEVDLSTGKEGSGVEEPSGEPAVPEKPPEFEAGDHSVSGEEPLDARAGEGADFETDGDGKTVSVDEKDDNAAAPEASFELPQTGDNGKEPVPSPVEATAENEVENVFEVAESEEAEEKAGTAAVESVEETSFEVTERAASGEKPAGETGEIPPPEESAFEIEVGEIPEDGGVGEPAVKEETIEDTALSSDDEAVFNMGGQSPADAEADFEVVAPDDSASSSTEEKEAVFEAQAAVETDDEPFEIELNEEAAADENTEGPAVQDFSSEDQESLGGAMFETTRISTEELKEQTTGKKSRVGKSAGSSGSKTAKKNSGEDRGGRKRATTKKKGVTAKKAAKSGGGATKENNAGKQQSSGGTRKKPTRRSAGKSKRSSG